MKSLDIIDAIRPVIKTFERVGILYYIGGSIASSAYGVARATLDEESGDAEFFISSSEDIILNKLGWFSMGGEIAERQWDDILGVIKVQRKLLDKKYLYRWAGELGVKDLLEKALMEALENAY